MGERERQGDKKRKVSDGTRTGMDSNRFERIVKQEEKGWSEVDDGRNWEDGRLVKGEGEG